MSTHLDKLLALKAVPELFNAEKTLATSKKELEERIRKKEELIKSFKETVGTLTTR
jgi:hypothetical protein